LPPNVAEEKRREELVPIDRIEVLIDDDVEIEIERPIRSLVGSAAA